MYVPKIRVHEYKGDKVVCIEMPSGALGPFVVVREEEVKKAIHIMATGFNSAVNTYKELLGGVEVPLFTPDYVDGLATTHARKCETEEDL